MDIVCVKNEPDSQWDLSEKSSMRQGSSGIVSVTEDWKCVKEDLEREGSVTQTVVRVKEEYEWENNEITSKLHETVIEVDRVSNASQETFILKEGSDCESCVSEQSVHGSDTDCMKEEFECRDSAGPDLSEHLVKKESEWVGSLSEEALSIRAQECGSSYTKEPFLRFEYEWDSEVCENLAYEDSYDWNYSGELALKASQLDCESGVYTLKCSRSKECVNQQSCVSVSEDTAGVEECEWERRPDEADDRTSFAKYESMLSMELLQPQDDVRAFQAVKTKKRLESERSKPSPDCEQTLKPCYEKLKRVKPVVCDECGKLFVKEASLWKHLLTPKSLIEDKTNNPGSINIINKLNKGKIKNKVNSGNDKTATHAQNATCTKKRGSKVNKANITSKSYGHIGSRVTKRIKTTATHAPSTCKDTESYKNIASYASSTSIIDEFRSVVPHFSSTSLSSRPVKPRKSSISFRKPVTPHKSSTSFDSFRPVVPYVPSPSFNSRSLSDSCRPVFSDIARASFETVHSYTGAPYRASTNFSSCRPSAPRMLSTSSDIYRPVFPHMPSTSFDSHTRMGRYVSNTSFDNCRSIYPRVSNTSLERCRSNNTNMYRPVSPITPSISSERCRRMGLHISSTSLKHFRPITPQYRTNPPIAPNVDTNSNITSIYAPCAVPNKAESVGVHKLRSFSSGYGPLPPSSIPKKYRETPYAGSGGDRTNSSSSDSKYTCRFCCAKFAYKSVMIIHQVVRHGIDTSM